MAASKNARKRQAPGTVSLQCPKRKAPAENSPTLTEIEDRASTIRCLYVRRVRTPPGGPSKYVYEFLSGSSTARAGGTKASQTPRS